MRPCQGRMESIWLAYTNKTEKKEFNNSSSDVYHGQGAVLIAGTIEGVSK